jgi:sugar/nucleoside kinase (ribokinase family)
MSMRHLDLACFSYLAAAQILRVDTYPAADGGAVVDATAAAIAGDGPLVAFTGTGLGLRTGLISNSVGADLSGRRLLEELDGAGVEHRIRTTASNATPQLTVIADNTTRTWFASLQWAYADLLAVDLSMLSEARLAYIDCYQVITDAAARCITAAEAPLFLNLGGDQPAAAVTAATAGRTVQAVQTNLSENAADTAEDLANDLYTKFHQPAAVIVTLGRLGAIARTRHGLHRAEAPKVVVTHTAGAGAAFSAGYAHAVLAGADVDSALAAACRAGTEHCTSPASLVPRQPVLT